MNRTWVSIFSLIFLGGSASCNRIVGGQDAGNGDHPYQASIRDTTDAHYCGGSVITARTILTSTYCILGRTTAISVVLGTNSLDASAGTRYHPERLVPHPWFSNQLLTNDVGLIVLNATIIMSARVQPIALEASFVGGGVDATLTGWGLTSYPSGVKPESLQVINLKTITEQQCKGMQGEGIIFETSLCTLTRAGEGSCNGDHGGPLVSKGKLIGIASWITPCAVGKPDVYSRVSSYVDWIEEHKVV